MNMKQLVSVIVYLLITHMQMTSSSAVTTTTTTGNVVRRSSRPCYGLYSVYLSVSLSLLLHVTHKVKQEAKPIADRTAKNCRGRVT